MMKCDPETGTCQVPDLPAPAAKLVPQSTREGVAIHYVGDPMCSWCWGISSAIKSLADFCADEGIAFTATMGGLRAGGGDRWNDQFRSFLRNEWNHIAQVTAQPFGYGLLDLPHFDYDTEPACRAVITAKLLLQRDGPAEHRALEFFTAVQERFYVQGQDPKTASFYRDPCRRTGLDFDSFEALFESDEARRAVIQNFVQCRQWGVRSFPTVLVEANGAVAPLSVGFVRPDELVNLARRALSID